LAAAVNEAKQVAADMRGLSAGAGMPVMSAAPQALISDGAYGLNTSGYLEMMGVNYQNVPTNISGYTTMRNVMYQNLDGPAEFSEDLHYVLDQDSRIGLLTYIGREFSHQWAKVNDYNVSARGGWQVVVLTPIIFGCFFLAGVLFFLGCFCNLKLGIASSWLGCCLPMCCGSFGCYLHLHWCCGPTIRACLSIPLTVLFGLRDKWSWEHVRDPLPRVRHPFAYGYTNYRTAAYRAPEGSEWT
jgi:hypothetical protein